MRAVGVARSADRLTALPVTQRSAVILKDVLGHSLEEIAETIGISLIRDYRYVDYVAREIA